MVFSITGIFVPHVILNRRQTSLMKEWQSLGSIKKLSNVIAVVIMTTELFSFTIQMIIRRERLLLSPGIFPGKM